MAVRKWCETQYEQQQSQGSSAEDVEDVDEQFPQRLVHVLIDLKGFFAQKSTLEFAGRYLHFLDLFKLNQSLHTLI